MDWERIAATLQAWDVPAEKEPLSQQFTCYQIPSEMSEDSDWVQLCRIVQPLLILQAHTFLVKKGLTQLISAAPDLPYLRASEWFDDRQSTRVSGTIETEEKIASLRSYPTESALETGWQLKGNQVTIVGYSLSPVDLGVWYRLNNSFADLLPAGWITATDVLVADGRELPFVAFQLA